MSSHTEQRQAGRLAVRLTVAALAAALVVVPQVFISCGAETAGEHVAFETAFRGAMTTGEGPPATFTTATGWSVTLTEAYLAVGPVYFYGGEAPATLVERLFVGRVIACPTHAQFDTGPVLGEVLAQYVVDLLSDTPQPTGFVQGVAGTVEAAEVHLHPPGDAPAGSPADAFRALDGETLALVGTASKDGTEIPFVARLTIPDSGLMRIVEGVSASVELLDVSDGPGALTVEALVDRWFDGVHFETLTEQDDDGRFLFSSGLQATNALLQGLRMRDAYRVTWSTP